MHVFTCAIEISKLSYWREERNTSRCCLGNKPELYFVIEETHYKFNMRLSKIVVY